MKAANLCDIQKGGDHLLFADEECDDADVKNTVLDRCIFDNVGLKQARFSGGAVTHCRFEDSYLRHCIFGQVDFTGTIFTNCNLAAASFAGSKLWYTQFVRCQLNYNEILQSLPTEVNLRKQLLRSLRVNAVDMGEKHIANRILLLELKAEREEHYKIFTSSNSYFRDNYDVIQRFQSLGGWIAHHLRSSIWGYGLRLNALFRTAVIVILSCGLAYWLTGAKFYVPHTSSRETISFLQALYFSAITFATLGFGDFSPADWTAQLLAAIESLCGCIFLGFLAASVYRRLAR